VVAVSFLTVRATSTLVAGASFARPGDGWRAVWQLLLVAILLTGIVRPAAAAAAAAITGAVYLAATGLELRHATDLLGVVPVDMRDRVVHPLLAVAAAVCLAIDARRREPGVSPVGGSPQR
jgi:hypothetical protein